MRSSFEEVPRTGRKSKTISGVRDCGFWRALSTYWSESASTEYGAGGFPRCRLLHVACQYFVPSREYSAQFLLSFLLKVDKVRPLIILSHCFFVIY